MSVNEMNSHVYELAKDMKVRIIVGDEFKSRVSEPLIMIEPIRSDADYASALHELGHQSVRLAGDRSMNLVEHCHCPRHQTEYWFLTLINEKTAWDWAKRNAIEWNSAMEERFRDAFGSYIYGAMRFYVQFKNELDYAASQVPNNPISKLLQVFKGFGMKENGTVIEIGENGYDND